MEKNLELSGLIHSKYRSETEMAKAMGWSRQRLNSITTGRKKLDLVEAKQLAVVLNVPISTIAEIFLREESPNGDFGTN